MKPMIYIFTARSCYNCSLSLTAFLRLLPTRYVYVICGDIYFCGFILMYNNDYNFNCSSILDRIQYQNTLRIFSVYCFAQIFPWKSRQNSLPLFCCLAIDIVEQQYVEYKLACPNLFRSQLPVILCIGSSSWGHRQDSLLKFLACFLDLKRKNGEEEED